MFIVKNPTAVVFGLVFTATLAAGVARGWAQEHNNPPAGRLADAERIPLTANAYCNLKFPAIRPSTPVDDQPQLKSRNTGDVVDFYGPCDHDPAGKDEVLEQRQQYSHYWDSNYGSD